MAENKPDSVPGLGFKDKEKAHETISILEGRDPDYQKLAIKGLLGRAKRVLTLTKDEEKLQNINDAIKIFEDWVLEFENSNRSKENCAYLPFDTMKIMKPLITKYSLETKESEAFFKAYKDVKGEYKHLRTVNSVEKEVTWDIYRNRQLKPIMQKYHADNPNLWDGDLPTKAHVEMIVWSHSPDAARIKKNLSKIGEKIGKEDSSNDSSVSSDDKSENDEKKRATKRSTTSSSDSSSSDSEESPKKKSKK